MSIKFIAEHVRRRRLNTEKRSHDPVSELAERVDLLGVKAAEAIRERCNEIIHTLESTVPKSADTHSTITALIHALTPLDESRTWLLLAVIQGQLPDAREIRSTARIAELDGTTAAISESIRTLPPAAIDPAGNWPAVKTVANQRLIDVHHTSRTDFATGIQRVTREVTRRWVDAHDPMLIGWRDDLTGIRALSPAEAHRACWGGPPVTIPSDDPILVPWKCTYILPELAAEMARAARLQAVAQYSGNRLSIIGHDLVPITTAETVHEGLVPGFAFNLAAVRHAKVVVCVSAASAGEYRGWRSMLASTGLRGPIIESVSLPTEAPEEDSGHLAEAMFRLRVGSLPMILVVGSHEPRKNHVAVLHAAELLWREGHQFSLTFIGGNSWNSDMFTDLLVQLQRSGRPVEAISAATDDLLWGGYRIARFTVFPSLNEGFGLPVAESLACGTPVVTSSYGSMKEIADHGGGALLVNPRDDHSIADGMRALLTDDELYSTLAHQAQTRPTRRWSTYAAETWDLLAGE